MKKLQFSTTILAPKEKVWKVLWKDANYRQWTSAFAEGSYAVSDWKEGSRILFLTPEGNGMYSTIARNIPANFMSFKHLGIVKNGEEQPLDEESRKWSGAYENYALFGQGGSTRLMVEIDVLEENVDYFNKTFPKALEIVKEVAEKAFLHQPAMAH